MRDHFLSSAKNGWCSLAIERTGATFVSDVEIARDSASRRRGLLGRESMGPGQAFVIAPSQGVHTFGMRFAIDIIAVARDGRVIKVRSRVSPRRVVLVGPHLRLWSSPRVRWTARIFARVITSFVSQKSLKRRL
jgi:hypothetical protein